MPPIPRASIALVVLCLSAGLAFAAGSSAPFGYAPDPALRTAGKGELQARLGRACAAVQAKLQGKPESAVNAPCGCYAARVMRRLDNAEIDAWRSTGVFNDTARAKALAALDACKLPRPL